VVEVEWLDSLGYGRWDVIDNHRSSLAELRHRSVGLLIRDDKDALTVAQSYNLSEPEKHIDNSITIPAVAVVRKHVLRKGPS
jgi:hypothetical protein